MVKFPSLVVIVSIFLTACAGKPVSYLPIGSEPIINIESTVAEKVKLDASEKKLSMANLTKSPINVIYKLFWYDKDGVTQLFNGVKESTDWQHISLYPNQKHTITLVKPTQESVNYRLYVRGGK